MQAIEERDWVAEFDAATLRTAWDKAQTLSDRHKFIFVTTIEMHGPWHGPDELSIEALEECTGYHRNEVWRCLHDLNKPGWLGVSCHSHDDWVWVSLHFLDGDADNE